MKKIISWLLVILWMILIFILSCYDGVKSTKMSTKGIESFISNGIKIGNIDSDIDINKLSNDLNYPIRKVLHFMEYFILTLLLYFVFKNIGIKGNKLFIYCILICVLYSISDEVHQLFTGRTSSILDVFIDSSGGLVSLLIMKCFTKK